MEDETITSGGQMGNSEKENELIKFVNDHLFKQAKQWKFYYAGEKQKNWLGDIKWYKGIQWGMRSKEKSSISLNRIFSIIQRELPFMTDKKPIIKVVPMEPSDKLVSEVLNRILETIWVKRDMDMKLPEGVMHAKQLGTSFLMPFWNDKLNDGLGDCDCKTVDPLEVFPLAYSCAFEELHGCIWARWVSMAELKRDYAKEDVDRVKPQKDEDADVPDRAKLTTSKSDHSYAQVTDTTGARTDYLPTDGGVSASDLKRVLLITLFIKDSTMKEDEEDDGKGKKTKISRPVYPNGRQITIANKVVLQDVPYAFKTFPNFIPLHNYINPGEYWGMSDITQIKEMQKELNKINGIMIDAMRRDVYRQKYILAGSGIDVDTFTNTSDSVYETRVPNPVSETGQFSLPAQAFQFPDYIEKAIQATAGSQDYSPPTSGILPSGRSFEELKEMNAIRLRQKIRNMEYSIRHVAKSWVEMILTNYTEERIMRLFNSNNDRDEDYVFIFKEENPQRAAAIEAQAKAEIIPGTEFVDPISQVPVPGTAKRKYRYVLNMANINFELDVEVQTGSTLSSSKIAAFDQAMALFDRQAIDQEALLDAADYPERQEIMMRMKEKAKQDALQMVQQQQTQMQQQSATGAKPSKSPKPQKSVIPKKKGVL